MKVLHSAVLMLAAAALAAPAGAQLIPDIGPASMYNYAAYGPSYLGVVMDNVTSDRLPVLKLKEETGVEIMHVDQDAPAGKIGLHEHDVILQFNGNKVESTEQLTRMIRETPAGRTVSLDISRDGQPMNFKVQLADYRTLARANWTKQLAIVHAVPQGAISFYGEVPEADDLSAAPGDGNQPFPGYTTRAGMTVENLTPQLGEVFGAKDGKGVLVRTIDKGSAAETAGIKAGDVIRKIGSHVVANRTDFRRILSSHKKSKVNVVVIREKREQNVTMTISPDQSKKGDIEASVHDLEA